MNSANVDYFTKLFLNNLLQYMRKLGKKKIYLINTDYTVFYFKILFYWLIYSPCTKNLLAQY